MEAPAHPVTVRNHFQQRGLRRNRREPRSADSGSAPRCTLSLGVGGHATASRHGRRGRVAALRAQGLVAAYLTRAVFPHQGAKLPFRSEREMRTLAQSLDLPTAGLIAAAADLLMQSIRGVEITALEDGGWTIARHLEVVPDTHVSNSTPSLRAAGLTLARKRKP